MGQGESMQLRWDGGSHPAKLGIMVCGHGSRNRKAVAEFAQLVTGLERLLPHHPLAYGYLEFAHPVIPAGLDRLRSAGVDQVVAVPAMLFAAGHVKNDIPALLNRYGAATGLPISYGRELGMDARMVRAAAARIRAALPPEARGEQEVAMGQDTLLVVVGRGSRDPDANGNVAKITRMLVEGLGLGWGETCYAGVTFPQVEDCLRRAVGLGLSPHCGLSLLPVFRGAGEPHSPGGGLRGSGPSPTGHPQSGLPQRPSPGAGHLPRPRPGGPGGRQRHELRPVQVPHPGAGFRGGVWRSPGEPSPSPRRIGRGLHPL